MRQVLPRNAMGRQILMKLKGLPWVIHTRHEAGCVRLRRKETTTTPPSIRAWFHACRPQGGHRARDWVRPGTSQVIINGREINDYFGRRT